MDIELRTNQSDPSLAIRNIDRFADGSGFRATLAVRSWGFQLSTPFLYFGQEPLVRFIDQLSEMDRSLKGLAKLSLNPEWEDQFIELELTTAGRLVVRGQLLLSSLSSRPGWQIGFEFDTDQTILTPLISDLQTCADMAAA